MSRHNLILTTARQGQGSRRERAVFPVLANGFAMAARIAPLRSITEQSMRQARRRAERHVAQLLGKVHKSARISAARHMIAAEGLATVGCMIAACRRGDGAAADYVIAWVTVELRDLRVRDRLGLGWISRTRMRT
jgi:hypothetical protein